MQKSILALLTTGPVAMTMTMATALPDVSQMVAGKRYLLASDIYWPVITITSKKGSVTIANSSHLSPTLFNRLLLKTELTKQQTGLSSAIK